MLDIGWTELLVIGVVALIVVGPRDLPVMFRTLGRFTGKARGMARDFQRAMDKAADESGVRDIGKTIRKAADPGSMGTDVLKDAAKTWTGSASVAGSAGSEKTPAPAVMTAERAEAAKKIQKAAAKIAGERLKAEAAIAENAPAETAQASGSEDAVTTPAPVHREGETT